MQDSEKLLQEIYGVLLVHGITMNTEEVRQGLKETGFDDSEIDWIMERVHEVQAFTKTHGNKLVEIEKQEQLSDREIEKLTHEYLKHHGLEDELIEVVQLYHGFIFSKEAAEAIVLQSEKEGLKDQEIRRSIRKTMKLKKSQADILYATAMTSLGKPYSLDDTPFDLLLEWLPKIGMFLSVGAIVHMVFAEDLTVSLTLLASGVIFYLSKLIR
jgi:hypothetical protein